jgi:DNA-binding CsgD family transcriptional regulator/tetratricopeptide (TPR) repeat protein
LVDLARAGHGRGLALRGEAGIGKSALLAYGRERAGGMRVLHATCVEAESALAYATLHQLLCPILHVAAELPPPQQQALRIALGLEAGGAPDRFLISLAALTLLSEAATEQPILCVLDDMHWADDPSREIVTFVARRLESEPIALLASVRDGEGRDLEAAGMSVLDVTQLSHEQAMALLDEQSGTPLAPAVRDALVAAANGNPLAVIELPRMLTTEQRAGRDPLPEPLPVPSELERVFLRTIDRLDSETQTVALLCAAAGRGSAGRGSLALIGRAAARVGSRTPLLELPGLEDILQVEGPIIDFRHPLMRSAVYHKASPAARRSAHLALADALKGDDEQADRRAWHRAEAAPGPDEQIADELERSANRTLRRSGYAAAVRILYRAADLSPADSDRVRRMVAAADAAWRGGDALRARALVQRAEQLGLTDPRARLNSRFLQGAMELRSGIPADGLIVLVDALDEAASLDPPLAARMLAVAGEAAFQAGDFGVFWKIGPVLARLPEVSDPGQRLLIRLLRAINPKANGEDPAQLREDLATAEQLEEPDVLIRVAGLAFGLGEYTTARRLWSKAAAGARASGAAGTLAGALRTLALDEMSRSRYAWAEASAAEGRALALETGQPNLALQHAAILAEVAGLRGREQDARQLADEILAEASRRGQHGTAALVRRALGQLMLAYGHPEEAIGHLEALWVLQGASNRAIAIAVVPDLVEASVRSGRPELAREWLSRLPGLTETSSPEGKALVLRSRALLAGSDEADALFDEALRAHATTERPLEQARTALLYGEYLRRERRRVDAREPLRTALDTFDRLGAVPWADRARSELRATGESARKRDVSTFDQLTRQELQVARVVGQGATNRAAAAQLFISPRTVDHHLRSIFQKLGVSSRSELIRLVAAGDEFATN